MKQQRTRRGNTQKVIQVAWNRRFASPLEGEGLSPRVFIGDVRRTDEGDFKKEHFILSPSPRALRGPLPQGARGTTRGFTLIELLVVVLIIGILAAVALPQYNKAVWKSRAVQTLLFMRNAGQALDRWVLENGAPKETVIFTGTKADGQLDLDLTEGMECDQWVCSNKNFSYSVTWEQTFWYVSVGYQYSYDSDKDLSTGAYASEEKDANHSIFKSCTSFDVDGAKFCAALCSLDSGFC